MDEKTIQQLDDFMMSEPPAVCCPLCGKETTRKQAGRAFPFCSLLHEELYKDQAVSSYVSKLDDIAFDEIAAHPDQEEVE